MNARAMSSLLELRGEYMGSLSCLSCNPPRSSRPADTAPSSAASGVSAVPIIMASSLDRLNAALTALSDFMSRGYSLPGNIRIPLE